MTLHHTCTEKHRGMYTPSLLNSGNTPKPKTSPLHPMLLKTYTRWSLNYCTQWIQTFLAENVHTSYTHSSPVHTLSTHQRHLSKHHDLATIPKIFQITKFLTSSIPCPQKHTTDTSESLHKLQSIASTQTEQLLFTLFPDPPLFQFQYIHTNGSYRAMDNEDTISTNAY